VDLSNCRETGGGPSSCGLNITQFAEQFGEMKQGQIQMLSRDEMRRQLLGGPVMGKETRT
jgi:hypothetical protein